MPVNLYRSEVSKMATQNLSSDRDQEVPEEV